MRIISKKPINRGAPMCVPFLLFLMIVGILSLARARPVEASKVTSCSLYCYDDLHNGNFKKKVKKYNKKGLKAKFNFGSRYVYARDAYPDKNGKYHVKRYDLKKHVVEGDEKTPYRYWFWIRCTRHHNAGYHDNSLYPSASRSGYVQTWSTESFAVTQSKLTTKSQNVMQYKSRPGGYTEVHRMVEISDRKWNASHSKKKHHSLVNTLGTTSGDNYGMDFYMVDLQKWFLKNNANAATFDGTLYFHHITRLNYSGGGAAYKHITSRARWESLARRHGFRSSGIATYPQYYNLKMKFRLPSTMKHRTEVYRLHTTKRHGRMGAWDKKGVPIEECQFKYDSKKGNQGLIWKKETPPGSIYKFKKNVTTYKDSDKQKYFLKGIRVEAYNFKKSTAKKEVYDRIAQFMITDDLNHNPVTGQENVKFNCYAKTSKKKSGIYLDNASLKQYHYTQRYQYGYKDDAHNVFRSWHLSNLKKPKSVRSNRKKVMSGKKTWKQCMDYLCNLYFKNTVSNNRIYLIYQKADKGMLSVNEEFYDYSYEKGEYVMADTTRVTELKLPSRNSTLSVEKINKMYTKEKGKKDARIGCTFRTRNSVRYYAQEYMMTYYAASDHKKKTMKINLDSICPSYGKGKYKNKPYWQLLPRQDKYFSGNWDEMQQYMNVIAAMRSYFNTANCTTFKKVDFSKNVVVTVKLYQPETPTTVVRYYDNGHSLEKIDSDEDIKKSTTSDKVNSMTGESTILNKSYTVGSAPKLVKESKTSYHLASDEEIAEAHRPLKEGEEDHRPVIVGARFESLSSHVAYHHRYHLGKEGEDPAYSQNEWDGIGDPRVIARHNKYKTSEDERTIEFPTNLRGNLVVEVWKDPIAEYTVEYYAGYKKMPDNYIIPEDMDTAADDADSIGAKVEYNRVYANTVTVDTEPGGNPPPDYITESFSIPETLAGVDGVIAGGEYKLVPKKSKALEDTSLQKKGLPVDSSRGVELKWRYGSDGSITLRYYYLRLESKQIITTPTPSPGVTPTPSPGVTPTPTPTDTPIPNEEITIYKWDDTNNTELGKSDNPTEQGNLDNAEITGQIYKDKIQKGNFDSGAKEVQTDFEDQMTADTDDRFVIPNGKFVNGKYEPNTVKSNAQNTAYLSKGKILKHVVTTKVPVTVYRSVYHKSSGKYSKQYATIPIVVQAAYFTVDELTVWRPEGAKVYNYAFPNSSGKKEGLDADGDCRSVAEKWWKEKDYNVNLAKNKMYGEWLKSNDKNWGSVKKTGCYKVELDKNDPLLTVKAPTVTVKGDSDPDKSSMNSTLLNRLPEIVREFWNNDTVKSDTLTFNHPDWEDLEEGAVDGDEKADDVVIRGDKYEDDNYEDPNKINIGKGAVTVTDAKEDISETKHVETLLKANTVTVKVCDSQGKVSSGSLKCKDPNSSNDEEAGDLVDFDKMSKWDERKLRIPPAKLSKNSGEETNGNTNLFTLNGIPINQSKLNTNVDTVISFRWFTRKKKAGV